MAVLEIIIVRSFHHHCNDPDRGHPHIPPLPVQAGARGGYPHPAFFMNASAAIADLPLRQAWTRWLGVQADGLVVRSVNILFQVCLP
ncbi:MAG: hypothetical protein ABI988_03565, partial [Nitrospirota bacterium]